MAFKASALVSFCAGRSSYIRMLLCSGFLIFCSKFQVAARLVFTSKMMKKAQRVAQYTPSMHLCSMTTTTHPTKEMKAVREAIVMMKTVEYRNVFETKVSLHTMSPHLASGVLIISI